MFEAFIIVLRESFEAFLIVAIILAYLRRVGRENLAPAAYWAIGLSVMASAAMGYLLKQGVNQALWEGVLGIVAIVMVATLVIHMWRTAPRLKHGIEKRLHQFSPGAPNGVSFVGVFLFTLLMITREGMETALMLLQVRDKQFVTGSLLGLAGAVLMAWAWTRVGPVMNLKRFFQVTGIFLLLFMGQVGVYSFHEFSEAGIFPNSDFLHQVTEPFSPVGLYGKWFSPLMIGICALWFGVAWVGDRMQHSPQAGQSRVLG